MKPRHWMFTTLAALAVLGCSDTASAQPQLIVMPATSAVSPLAFNDVPAGGVSQSQSVTVATQDSTTSTVIIQVSPASPWLQVTPSASVNIPATLSVACNTTLLNSGTYNGSFTITVDGAPQDQVTVYVSLTVSGISALSATPPTLQFTAQAGATSGTPTSATVQIASSTNPLNYTLAVNYLQPSGNWLLLSTTAGATTGPPFTVSVNPSVVAATQYPATFQANLVASSTTTADSVVIGVQLTITSAATLTVTPANPQPFLYQAGTTSDPPPQQLSLSTNEGPLTYSIQESPPVTWLVLSALGGTASTTPSTITLNATPFEQSLQPGTYTTSLIVTPTDEQALTPIPITLYVAAHPLLRLSTNTLSFTAAFAGAPVAAQTAIVASSGATQVGFTVTSSQSWLTASASATTTPATLTVQVNPAGLSIQTYTGTLTLAPTNGDNYTETITVTLNVTSPSQLEAAPNAVLFSYETGEAPPGSQTIEITSTGQPLQFLATANPTNCGSNWLTVTPPSGTSTTSISIGVVTAGLSPGTCSGNVSLSYTSGTGPATLVIPVTLVVSNTAVLTINMAPGFGLPQPVELGNGQFVQQISLTSTDPNTPVDFSANVINVGGGAWLGISGATTGNTPQNLNIQFTPGALSIPGTYTGTLVISSSTLGAAQLSLEVTLTVTTATTVTVTPTALTFSENQGGSPPAAQTLTLATSPGTATYTAVLNYLNNTGWLQISPNSGNASGPMTVTVPQNTLSVGQYNAQILFSFQNSATTSQIVDVTLNVLPAQTISVSPSSLNFTYQIGGATPASQTLTITSTSGSATVAVMPSSSGWLAVNSSGGTTPQTITVSVNPQGLAQQNYAGSIAVTAPGVLSSPINIPVSFNVSTPPGPQPVYIINNATGVSSAIAPGEEIAIKGTFLGPATPANGTLFSVSNGTVSNTLAGVQVLFDSIPGTPIYVSQNQINVMVPYEINGRISTNMVVEFDGGMSSPFPLAVEPAAPGLFTDNFTGAGQVAAVNQDGSFNGSSGSGVEAAPRGTVISLYGTGGGQTSPPSVTGSVTPIPQNASQLLNIAGVTATIGGVSAPVTFAGAAPGLVTGVIQVNIMIPSGVTPGGAVPVTISVGGIASPAGTTIAVQ